MFKDACDHIGPIQLIENNLSILRSADSNLNSIGSLNSPPPCKLTIHRFWGLGRGGLGRVGGWGGGRLGSTYCTDVSQIVPQNCHP